MEIVRTLVVWCPDWPLVAAGVPATTPAAVIAGANAEQHAGQHAGQVVLACTAAARDDGVRRGLRIREAQRRCPQLTVLLHDEGRDIRAFEPVVAAVEAFTPRVEVVRPGVCSFATKGPARYFGGDAALADKVTAAVAGLLPAVGVGIADGPFAADLAARRSVVVPPGGSAAFLARLPVSTLDRPELADLLVRLGVRTLGDFAALPAASVLDRFGNDGARAHRLASGLDDRLLVTRQPPPDLTVEMELDPPIERVDTAAFAAKALAEQFHERLARRGLICMRVSIEAETEHGESLARLWRHDGALTTAAVAERMRWQLDGWITGTAVDDRPTAGITLLRLVPDQVAIDEGVQDTLWGGRTEQAERAERALARVQGLLGPEAVVTAVPGGGRTPAEQITWVPWGDLREPARSPAPPWPGRIPPPFPATVYPTALPAAVHDEDGRPVAITDRYAISAAPARVVVDGELPPHPPGQDRLEHCPGDLPEMSAGNGSNDLRARPESRNAVVGWAGPWPVDERWWDPHTHRRRMRLQVLTADGTGWLLALDDGRWWAEARYD